MEDYLMSMFSLESTHSIYTFHSHDQRIIHTLIGSYVHRCVMYSCAIYSENCSKQARRKNWLTVIYLWFPNIFQPSRILQLCLLIISIMNIFCMWTATLRVFLEFAPDCIQSHLLHHQVEGKSTALTLNTPCWLSLCHNSLLLQCFI